MKFKLTLYIVLIFSISLSSQVHRNSFSSSPVRNEIGQDITCQPCNNKKGMVSLVDDSPGNTTDDYLSVDLYDNNVILNNITFPSTGANINDYSFFGNARIQPIIDPNTQVCQGYIVAFTAKTNQASLPGTSFYKETHIMRLDANLNVIYHKIPFNNVGYSNSLVDYEIDYANSEIILLMAINSNRTMMAKASLALGTISSSKEIEIYNGPTLNSQASDLELTDIVGVGPKYVITGKSLDYVFVFFINANLTLEKQALYDIDSDNITDEDARGISILGNSAYVTGTVESMQFPVVNTYSYMMEIVAKNTQQSNRGNVVSTTRYGVPDNGSEINAIKASNNGNGLILAGQSNILEAQFMNNTEGTPFIMEVDLNGTPNWAKKYHATAVDEGKITSLETYGTTICACGEEWPDLSNTVTDVLEIATDAAGNINTICDSTAIVNTAVLSSTKLSSTGYSVNTPSATNTDISGPYGTHSYILTACSTSLSDTVSGIKWIDVNCDGLLNNGETGVSGWTINLKDSYGNILQSTVTDNTGFYQFVLYFPGTYYVEEVNIPSYDQNTPSDNLPYTIVSNNSNQHFQNKDFGNCGCDGLIGYNPPPTWNNPGAPSYYVYDAMEFGGHIFALVQPSSSPGLFFLYHWEDVTETWYYKYTFPGFVNDIQVFDNKLFFGGTFTGYFDNTLYATTNPVSPSIIGGVNLTVVDFEVSDNRLYAGGSGSASSNIWSTGTGTPSFVPSSFPNTYDVYQLGTHFDTNLSKDILVVIGPFGTNLSPPSKNIVFYDPTLPGLPVYTGLGNGIDGLLAPNFEFGHDIVSLNNKIHISGRFSGVDNQANTSKYAIYDVGSNSWDSNTGISGSLSTIGDMDLYQNHIYIVGFFTAINGQNISSGTVFDGSTYYPLNNNVKNVLLYAENVVPTGADKLFIFSETIMEYAVCGGDNCSAQLDSVFACPNEPILFLPYTSFTGGTFTWDFGDGTTATGKNPSHSYIVSGNYTISMTYDDGNGCMDTIVSGAVITNDPSCSFIPDPTPWEKLYGDTLENIPIKVKRTPYGEMLVLANIDLGNGIKKGTLSKFDVSTGSLIWQFSMADNIEFRDIEFDLSSRNYLIVGMHTPLGINGVNQDNSSAIIQVVDNGTTYSLSTDNTYPQLGREFFEEITRHKNPPAGVNGHSYYFTGAMNYATSNPPPPSYRDLHVIGNMDKNRSTGTGSWYESTTHTGDDEYQRGLFTLSNGRVVTVGNDGNGRGTIVELDPISGAQVNAMNLMDPIDLYHGIELFNGHYLVCGTKFNSDNALLAIINPSTNTLLNAYTFNNIKNFEEIFVDQYGDYYATGQSTDPNFSGQSIVVKLDLQYTAPSTYNMNLLWAKYLNNNETNFDPAHIYVDDQSDNIYYADSRENNPNGYGQSDMLVAIFDLEMTSSPCILNYTTSMDPYTVSINTITPSVGSLTLPIPTGNNVTTSMNYLCDDICEPMCTVDWTWTQDNCWGADFVPQLTGVAPYSYSWDIFNDSSPDYFTANAFHDFGQPGTYTVCLTVTDATPSTCTECKTITIGPDTSNPIITCPPNVNVSAPACDRGSVATWSAPTATDCGDPSVVSIVCDYNSGDFFPCGVTPVMCIATDDEGMKDTCVFNVIVNCTCNFFTNLTMNCDTLPDSYTFEADLINQTGSGMTCNIPILSSGNPADYTLNIISTVQNSNGDFHIEGTFFTQACPMVGGFVLNATTTCICLDTDSVTCSTSTFFPAICCDSVYIDPQGICSAKDSAIIQLQSWNTVKDIQRINWYLEAGPCPSSGGLTGLPFFSSIGYKDLVFNPSLFGTADLCVYAEVILGNDEAPCDSLFTEIVQIDMCDPVSCSMTPNQVYCYTPGTPIQAGQITLNPAIPDCDYTIEWFDPQGNLIPSNTNLLTYTPPPLSMTNPQSDCSESFIYTVKMTGPCGPVTCSSSVILDSEIAPIGEMNLLSPNSPYICDGRDAILEFIPDCIGATWTWYLESPGQTGYQAIPGAGASNPLFNTNSLNGLNVYKYKIIGSNGSCPDDTVGFDLIVQDTFLTTCAVTPLDSCRRTGVKLEVGVPNCGNNASFCDCNFDVIWYKDGQLISSNNYTTSNANFNYIDFSLNGNYGGCYYADIIYNCCADTVRTPTKCIAPPAQLTISGPCYICAPPSLVTLTGNVSNPPSGTPTYQWFQIKVGGPVLLGQFTGNTMQSNSPGLFRLVVTYPNGCTLSQDFNLNDCSNTFLSALYTNNQTGNIVFTQSQFSPVLRSPNGTYWRIAVGNNGIVNTDFYIPNPNSNEAIRVENGDVLINEAGTGLVLQSPDNTPFKIYVEGQGIRAATSQFPINDGARVINAFLVFEQLGTGLVFTNATGTQWRLQVTDFGYLYFEQLTP